MKKITKIMSYIRYILLIVELFLLFSIIYSFIDLGVVTILFIIAFLAFIIINIKDFLVKRSINRDIVYILMNILLFVYFVLFWYRVYLNNVFDHKYLLENYSFLTLSHSILIIYNLFYERLYKK